MIRIAIEYIKRLLSTLDEVAHMQIALIKAIKRIRKQFFMKRFRNFDISSGVGKDGCGKGCLLAGTQHISIGKDCYFGQGTELSALKNHFDQKLQPCLIIGDHVRCVGGCRITCAGNISIEDDVLLGPEVFITDHNHGMNPDYPGGYSRQPLIIKDVRIGKGVWLGQRVCVMPGVTIGEHSIIGANSVVTKDIPPHTIAAGCPAKVVKIWNSVNNEWISM